MPSLNIKVAAAGAETGALLQEYLEDLGILHNRHADYALCYGLPCSPEQINLNAQCGLDKITRMQLMQDQNVQVVPWFTGINAPTTIKFPLLARKTHGHGGTDLMPVFEPQEIPWRIAAGWDWFSSYVPVQEEYRVWMFQGILIDTFKKVMRRPQEYQYLGRNFRNGFEFELCEAFNPATQLAQAAIKAIGLDFGAVDMIHGRDGSMYILEVNTAPGVIRSGAQNTLRKFASHVQTWLTNI